MEKQIKLKTKDGYTIYGVFNTRRKRSNTLAIFVHGLTGHSNGHSAYNASRLFPKRGIDTFRFALYSGSKGGRKLDECFLTTHAEDLNRVVSYLRPKYKNISVIGHSLGSPTILLSDTSRVDNVILWDPSHLVPETAFSFKKTKLGGKEVYITTRRVSYLIHPKLYKEWRWFNGKRELSLIENLNKPLLIIAAEKGILVAGSKNYFKAAQNPKKLVVIKNATHTFDEEGTEEKLFIETIKWIKKHTK